MYINHLTNAEEQLMFIMWDLKNFQLKDLMNALPEPKLHQNTISTYLKILVEKNFLSAKKEGRIFQYSVMISQSDYKKYIFSDFMAKYCNNSSKETLQFIINEGLISETEISQLTGIALASPKLEIAEEILKEKKTKKKKKDKKKKTKKLEDTPQE